MNCRPVLILHTSSRSYAQPFLVEWRQCLAVGLCRPIGLGLQLAAAVNQAAEISLAEQIDLRVAAADDGDLTHHWIKQVGGARGLTLRIGCASLDQRAANRRPAPMRLG